MAELSIEQKRAIAMAEARRKQAQQSGAVNTVARNVGEPFNRGLAQSLQFPTDLMNAALRAGGAIGQSARDTALSDPNARASLTAEFGIPNPEQFQTPEPAQIPADVQGGFQRMGLTAPPEQQASGVVPRAAEIMGGSVTPGGAIGAVGKQAVKQAGTRLVPPRAPLQQAAATTAQRPVAAGATDVASSGLAAAGGAATSQFTDDPTLIAIGELAGGFSPALTAVLPSVQAGRFISDKVKKTLIPFTEGGAEVRAAERLQSLVPNPREAASRIGTAPELSPARQTGEKRLIALEDYIRSGDAKLDQTFTDELNAARQSIMREADFGGDPERAVKLLEVVARKAGEEAQAKVAQLGSNAPPREISRVARESLESAMGAARKTESRLWEGLDKSAPSNLGNSRETLSSHISSRSRFDDPDDIPSWLVKALSDDLGDDVLAQLSKSGFLDSQGNVPPAIRNALGTQEPMTLGDAQALRKRVLAEIRAERAQPAPNRNRIRILSDVQESLLDDMAETGVAGVDQARAFSKALNDKFTRGPVGRLLGHERAGGSATAAEDTLDTVVFGSKPATSIQQFIETNSQAPEQVLQFLKTRYLEMVAPKGDIDPAAHDRFVQNLKKKGVLDIFPQLEGELNQAAQAANKAAALQVDESQINTVRQRTGQSKATLFLQGERPDEAFDLVLRAKNPAAATRSLVEKVGGDELAMRGLKTGFAGSIMRASMADGIVNGNKMNKLIDQYGTTIQALKMTNGEVNRLRTVANKLAKANANPDQSISTLLADEPAAFVDFVARVLGARAGANLSQGTIGGSIQTASEGAKRFHQILGKITKGKAGEMVEAAFTDDELMKALLTRSNAPKPEIDEATRVINSWMLGVASTEGEQ